MCDAWRVVPTPSSDRWNDGDHRTFKKLLKDQRNVRNGKSFFDGFGLFLLKDAPPGTNIIEYTGERYSLEEMESRYAGHRRNGIVIAYII